MISFRRDNMVRLSVFPILFGASLVGFAVGFINRRKLFPEIEEIHREKAILSHYQAIDFKTKVAEGVKKERQRKASEK